MPEQTVALLKSGKASFKTLATGKRLEMHRDAICSAALRVAIEFLATLPIGEVEVLRLVDLLNAATGHIESVPVLHVRVDEQAGSYVDLLPNFDIQLSPLFVGQLQSDAGHFWGQGLVTRTTGPEKRGSQSYLRALAS